MLSGSDVALARLAFDAYGVPPNPLPAGFTPVTLSTLAGYGLTLSSQEFFSSGLYVNQNAAALVAIGTLNGITSLVLSFRGSDNEQDSVNDLQNINREYPLYTKLIAAVDALASKQAIPQVVVTGHSLGGAMDQLFMASHADNSTTKYLAESFGSPGVLQSAGTDSRITLVQTADDPAVYLGLHRASVGAMLQSNPALAAAALFEGSNVFPGLSPIDVANSIGDLNTDYVNRGTVVLLPDADGSLTTDGSLSDAINAGKSEHDISTYVARLQALTNSTGDDQAATGITPTTTGVQIFRFFDSSTGTHFYTASASEEQSIQATRTDLVFEGVGLNAVTQANDPAAAPIFRFFDTTNGSHFYTASSTEAATIQNSNPALSFEGTAFYEDTSARAGDTAVYRFFDTQNGAHFYTPNLNELASIDATRSDLVNEGVAFYTLKA